MATGCFTETRFGKGGAGGPNGTPVPMPGEALFRSRSIGIHTDFPVSGSGSGFDPGKHRHVPSMTVTQFLQKGNVFFCRKEESSGATGPDDELVEVAAFESGDRDLTGSGLPEEAGGFGTTCIKTRTDRIPIPKAN